ncbi:hypothetical protein [Glycomyces paridis]|uniref:Uncharacterized protein n=1 Tax=Glycomyces paridis TaxID=2126555 RepID=A0A4S8PEQ5_9ACTN|nr:hypothetical protein [Glycomyces paridis]THV28351.1 hypothetical protein E9998_12135 [Glycomyces paridis]
MRKFEVGLEGHGNICARSSKVALSFSKDDKSEEDFEADLIAALEQSEEVRVETVELAEAGR